MSLEHKYTPVVYFTECILCDFVKCADANVVNHMNNLQSFIDDVDYDFNQTNIGKMFDLFTQFKNAMHSMPNIDDEHEYLRTVVDNIDMQWRQSFQ
jgi:hypothetical protein